MEPGYKIVHVICGEDYQVELLLESGRRLIYDLKPKLMTARFLELSDIEVFRTGYSPNGRCICWSTGAELSLDEIFLYMGEGNTNRLRNIRTEE